MWEKLNFFGWNKKKEVPQPVQREVSITRTNGETVHRSPSGTKLATSSSVKHGLDDDESSEGSTSLNFGLKVNPSTRRNSSFSFSSMEPLDLPTWSNVTSPGFASRLVQQASGHSPLKEFNDSLSFSPFRKSPHRHLQLGEMPLVNFSSKPKLSPPSFPSPNRSMKTGVPSTVYNRDRRKSARPGTVFVRIAPIDPMAKASILKSPQTPVGLNGNVPLYPARGSPRSNEPYRNEGLGGISSHELAMRYSRMWPPSTPPGTPLPGPSRPTSPTAPSNIVEILQAGRKRGREQDGYYSGPGVVSPAAPGPSKISIGIGDTPVRSQMSKRVKFVGGPEGHDRPMISYSGIGGGDNEPLSSESILEQMNQTEKRFLPDSDTSTPFNIKAGCSSGPGCDDQSSTLQSALRKRRSQTNMLSAVDEETRSEKVGRFCNCNECYAEAAGVSSFVQPQTHKIQDGCGAPSASPNRSNEKSPGSNDSHPKCDKCIGTDADKMKAAFFKDIFRKPDKKPTEVNGNSNYTKDGKVILTKEMNDRDKKKRIERYYRILSLKPPGGSIFDVTAESEKNSSENATSTAPATTIIGSLFGTPVVASSNGGFHFGKQTSPIALTMTTTSCSTISSPCSTGSIFGSNSMSNTLATSAVNSSFGTNVPVVPSIGPIIQLPTASTSIGLSTTTAPANFSFSNSSSNQSSTLKPVTDSNSGMSTTGTSIVADKVVTSTAGGFNFGNSSSTVPTFGQPSAASISTSSGSPPQTSFGLFGSSKAGTTDTTDSVSSAALPSIVPVTSAPITSTVSAPQLASTGSLGGFSFGSPITSASPAPASSTMSFSTGTPLGQNSSSNLQQSTLNTTFNTSTTNSTTASNLAGISNTTSFSAAVANSSSFGSTFLAPSKPAEGSEGKSLGLLPTTSSIINTTTPASAGGFHFTNAPAPPAFGQFGASSSPAPTTTASAVPTFGGFGSSTSADSSVFGGTTSAFPSSTTTATTTANSSPSGGFKFASVPNPLANKSAPTFGNFGGSAVTTTTNSSFGATTSNPTFGATTTNTSFGSTTGNPTFGAATTNTFSATPPNTFGATANPTFGATTANPPFGATTSSVPAFGSFTATTASTQSFGTAPVTATASAFRSVATNNSTPIFGANSGNSASSAPGTSVFGQPSNTFGSSFGSAETTTSSTGGGFNFGGAAATPVSSTATTSAFSMPAGQTNIFGSTGNQTATPFGQAATGTTSVGLFGATSPPNPSAGGSSGGFNFSSIPNPLAKPASTTFGGFGSPVTTTATTAPTFGSLASTTAPITNVFGGGNNNSGGYGFGSNTMSPPQTQPSTGGFAFGNTPQPSAPAPALSSGFAFGQSAANTTAPSAPSPSGVFQFGQTNNAAPAPGAPFQFGQQGVPGGFNFAAAAPAGATGQPMFSMGSTSTAPRRRDVRRRHR